MMNEEDIQEIEIGEDEEYLQRIGASEESEESEESGASDSTFPFPGPNDITFDDETLPSPTMTTVNGYRRVSIPYIDRRLDGMERRINLMERRLEDMSDNIRSLTNYLLRRND